MDSGLIQMLVIGLFIVITMMEGATRKKRRQAEALQRPDETEVDFPRSLTGDEQGESEATEGLVPHDIWAEIAELARGGTAPTAEPAPDPEPRLRMDAGPTQVALPVSVPEGREVRESVAMTPYEPASLVRTDSREEESEEEREEAKEAAASATFHRLHSSGLADLEKDAHYARASGGRSAMLRLFGERGGREDELRRAVILSEILGPPVSMREPREP
ncbi:MAG: hypothetical protein IH968_16165 [Gemmatimonadetes bacterium]|nr:hypothetical protein [Gemmatimonadota bacterium]